MSGQIIGLAGLLALFTALSALLFMLTFRPQSAASMANRLERSIGLAIPNILRVDLSRRLVRRRRISLAGTVLATWAVLPLVWGMGGVDASGSPTSVFLIVGASFAGGSIGAAIGSLQWPVQRDGNAIRYARVGAVSLRDYIPPFERRGTWVMAALAVFLFLGSVIMNVAGVASIALLPPATALSVLAAATVVSLGFFEIVGRRIVGRAQPTGSELELVWDDALRSLDVRDLASAPMMLGIYAALVTGTDLVTALQSSRSSSFDFINSTFAGMLALIIIIVVLGVFWIASRPERYFLKRLWPQYVDVGRPPLDAADPEASTS